jgi:hypothetical protein
MVSLELSNDEVIGLMDEVLFYMSLEEIEKYIIKVEYVQQDYGLSEALYKHFKKIHKEYLKENKKDM